MDNKDGGSGVALLVAGLVVLGIFMLMGKKSTPAQATNEETWEWTDWQGRQRNVTVHRKVQQE